MKRIILIILVIPILSLFSNSPIAQAKSYDMSTNFAKSLKKGEFPRSGGGIDTSYKTLKKNEPSLSPLIKDEAAFNFYTPQKNVAHTIQTSYYFNVINKAKPTSKIIAVERCFDYKISTKSLTKHFGKPYWSLTYDIYVNMQSPVYKVGKYYLYVSYYGGSTIMLLSSKKNILDLTHSSGLTKHPEYYKQ